MSGHDGGSFWRGLFFGGLLGAALGAALTAQADPETRQRLQRTAQELTDRSRDVAAKSRDLSLGLLEQAGIQANHLLEHVQEALTKESTILEEAIQVGVQAGREEIHHLREKLSAQSAEENREE